MKYLVKCDTKAGVTPSMSATVEVDAVSQRAASQQAQRQFAYSAGLMEKQVRVRKVEEVLESA